MVEQVQEFIWGAGDLGQLAKRLRALQRRAQAAQLAGKEFSQFWAESGRDWLSAPYRLGIWASQYAQLVSACQQALAALEDSTVAIASGQKSGHCWRLEIVEQPTGQTSLSLEPAAGPLAGKTAGPGVDTLGLAGNQSGNSHFGSLEEAVLEITARLTGYGVQDLSLELDIAFELGIDSLKMTQIVAELCCWAELSIEPELACSQFVNLEQIVDYLRQRGAAVRCTPLEIKPAEPVSLRSSEHVIADLDLLPRAQYGAWYQASAKHLHVPLDQVRLRKVEAGLVGATLGQLAADSHDGSLSVPLYVASSGAAPFRLHPFRVASSGPELVAQWYSAINDPLEVASLLATCMGGQNNALVTVVAALMQKFISEVSVAEPNLSSGPMLFLSNHQTALEGYLFPLLAPIIARLPMLGVAMLDHGVEWADALADFMFSHQDLPSRLVAPRRSVKSDDSWGLLQTSRLISHDLASGQWALHIVAEGRRELQAGYRLQQVSWLWLDLALQHQMPLVPVRFSGALPAKELEVGQDFPYQFGSEQVSFGQPLYPDELAKMSGEQRRRCVLEALNDFPELADEQPHRADWDFAQQLKSWVTLFGGSEAATVVLCCLQRYLGMEQGVEGQCGSAVEALTQAALLAREPGLAVLLCLPDNADGRWVGPLAKMIFGQRGPEVVVGEKLSLEQTKTRRVVYVG